jgi:hypothetical protein
MYFNYDHLKFRYDPYPIGLAKPLMEEELYRQFLSCWPDTGLFKFMPKFGSKYSLSQKFNARQYRSFIKSVPLWKDFHAWIKSDSFVRELMETLRQHHIDLGYEVYPGFLRRITKNTRNILRGRFASNLPRLTARFEFQMMPADGGHILPHTDTPRKIVTMVVSMLQDGEWDPGFGGGTDVNRPKDMHINFNRLNRQARFEDMEVLDSFEFTPNQAVIFIKTFNSWHSVRPMLGAGSAAMRKTLIINIETDR